MILEVKIMSERKKLFFFWLIKFYLMGFLIVIIFILLNIY